MKLSNPRRAYLLGSLLVIGAPFFAGLLPFLIPTLRTEHRIIAALLLGLLVLAWIIGHFGQLLSVEMVLMAMCAYDKARRSYPSAAAGKEWEDQILRRANRIGKAVTPAPLAPAPDLLIYRSAPSMTVLQRSIEKLILLYRTDLLDREELGRILQSARENVRVYAGSTHHRFLDKEQKAASPAVCAAVLILAQAVEDDLREELFACLSKENGDGYDTAVLPCVIDLARGIAVLDSLELPSFIGTPAKNRTLRMIGRCVFGGDLPWRKSTDRLPPDSDLDQGATLLSLWKQADSDAREFAHREKQIFESLKDEEGRVDEELFYVKLGKRALSLFFEKNRAETLVYLDEPTTWDHPRTSDVSEKDAERIRVIAEQTFGIPAVYGDAPNEDDADHS